MSVTNGNVRRHPVWRVALATLLLVAGGGQLSAHKVTPDPVVDVFLRATGDHLAVKVWLPMAALGDANLPRTSDGHFVRDEIQPALDVVARGIARDLELQEGDNPLAARSVATTMSPDESFVAIDLDYPIRPDRTDWSGRFHTFRGNGQMIGTQVHYIVDDRRTRTFVVDGQPQRISFAPTVLEVLRHFVDEGSDVLFESADFLLLAVCLVAVARTRQTTSVAVAAVLAGQVLIIVLSSTGLLAVSPATMLVLAALAASAVVVLAIQDVASAQSRWLPALCFGFGAASGTGISARFLHDWGFTGTHVVTGLVGFVVTISIGEIWVVALLWSAAGLVRRRGRIAELAVMSAAIFAGHSALHRVVDQGQALADAGTFTLDRFLFTLTMGWAALMLCAGILEAALSAGAGEQSRTFAGPRKIETR
jgi:HupE / UreJ protein